MINESAIEWTDATWNPVTGCTKVSKGCDNCYAERLAHEKLRGLYLRRLPVVETPENNADPFAVRIWPKRLSMPWELREPRMIFVNSMSDFFHADVPEEFQRSIFKVMLREHRHIYQILTKRPSRAARFVERNADLFADGIVPDHIWIGTSVEDMEVIYRVDHLRAVPLEVRFLSCEPLLGPLTLDLDGIHWVIVGGESGPVHRPMAEEWVTDIRDQCAAQGVPFFFKQWGGLYAKAGGRLLEGLTWDEYPAVAERLLAVAHS